jgi:hypothetical protein
MPAEGEPPSCRPQEHLDQTEVCLKGAAAMSPLDVSREMSRLLHDALDPAGSGVLHDPADPAARTTRLKRHFVEKTGAGMMTDRKSAIRVGDGAALRRSENTLSPIADASAEDVTF